MDKNAKNGPLTPLAHAFLGLIWVYQRVLSPLMGNQCRFFPTCSNYAIESITKYGALKGGGLALQRILRCHPWSGPGGMDPVP